jgi:hypothetical protein
VEGIGEAKPPQNLPFLAHCGGEAAAVSQKIKDLGGLAPSKPPAKNVGA